MLNQGGRASASTSQKAKWRFDRETGEWVCDAPALDLSDPPVVPSPAPPITWTAAPNTPGVSYAVAPVFTVTSPASPAVVSPAAPPAASRKAAPKRSPRDLLHPDVVLPLVAALIVLILFLAWAV